MANATEFKRNEIITELIKTSGCQSLDVFCLQKIQKKKYNSVEIWYKMKVCYSYERIGINYVAY